MQLKYFRPTVLSRRSDHLQLWHAALAPSNLPFLAPRAKQKPPPFGGSQSEGARSGLADQCDQVVFTTFHIFWSRMGEFFMLDIAPHPALINHQTRGNEMKPKKTGRGRAARPAKADKPKTTDDYLAAVSEDKRAALETLRKTIKAAAPKAEECISYGLPAFRLKGKFLVAYGAAAQHCAIGGLVVAWVSPASSEPPR